MSDKQESHEQKFDWEGATDLTALSKAELKRLLVGLVDEEREVSYRRRVIQGRIDLIRTELVGRDALTLSSEDLARVLMDAPPSDEGKRLVPPNESSTSRSTE